MFPPPDFESVFSNVPLIPLISPQYINALFAGTSCGIVFPGGSMRFFCGGSTVVPRGASMADRITKRAVDAAKPADQEYFLWDGELLGFGLRVLPSGVKSYVAKYRLGPGRRAPVRRVTIGKHGKITPDGAREEARKILANVVRGGDPANERARQRRELTVGELADRYIAEHVRVHNKATTVVEFERLVAARIKPAFGSQRLSALMRADVKAWHTALRSSPYAANRALAVLRKMFSLAVKDWELMSVNPALGVKMFREIKRERFASDDDLARIGRWLLDAEKARAVRPGFALAVRLLALTGMRLGEVLTLEWSAVDIEGGVIRLADANAKAGARVVALGAPACALLAALETRGRFVVTGDDLTSPLPRTAFRAGWRDLRAGTGLADLRPHDLRHTAGTFAAQSGANAFLVRDLLGHKTLAMTGRYVERATDPLRAVADQVAGRVAAAMDGQKAPVVSLDRRRG
jgi:integrase